MPEGDGQDGQREQLARAFPGDHPQQPRDEARAGHDHEHGEAGRLGQGDDEIDEWAEPARCRVRARAAEERGDPGKQDEDDDRGDVLDDQPADGDPPLLRVELAPVRERAEQDDGARDRHRQAQDEPAAEPPPESHTEADPEHGHGGDLNDRARDRDALDGEQVPEREVDADAEHQQDDAELGELRGDARVGSDARGERPDDDAGGDVADDRGQPQPSGDEAADESGSQPDRDGRDENGLVVHGSSRGRRGGAQDWRGSVPERSVGASEDTRRPRRALPG